MGGSSGGGKGGATVPSVSDLLTISPEQQALADFTLGQANVKTRDRYAQLGLGGSTMEAQDEGANQLGELAQVGQLQQGNAQVGLGVAGLQQSAAAQAAQQSTALGSALGKAVGGIFGGK